MPVTDESELKELLRERPLQYSVHYMTKVEPYRDNASRENIEANIRDPSGLLEWAFQEDDEPSDKYVLVFDHSTKYLLRVVVADWGEYLNIVTAHVVSKRRLDAIEEIL